MQVHRSKTGGCLDMSHVSLVAGFLAATALGLFLILYLDFSTGVSCGPDHQSDVHITEPFYYLPVQNESMLIDPNATACSPSSSSSPDAAVREWERPSVTEEREWEKLRDENIPEVQRNFTPIGVASFLFIQFGAYRTSPHNFSLVGLSPKTLHIYGNPSFNCSWIPNVPPEKHQNSEGGGESVEQSSARVVDGVATAYLPGIKLADQYTGTVIHCVFDRDVGTDGAGGKLQVAAHMGSEDMTGLQSVEFKALEEGPGEYERSLFEEPLKYDHVYCGSPLYGAISPQRVREWVAYHVMVFGPRSHFILYDAGGLHDDVRKILAPWVKLGKISIMNYRQEARYDSHYHSQAVSVNDCLMQAKRIAEWAFFFDLDEYLDVPQRKTLSEVMREIAARRGRRAQQVTLNQMPMNPDHCVKRPSNESYQSLWGIEELVFQRTQVTEWGGWKDHKYAVQTRYILAAGTHDHEFAQLPEGKTKKDTIEYLSEDRLHYHHYHKTISVREDLCKQFVDPWVRQTKFNNVTHVYDNSMASLADSVRQFETETIGPQPYIM